MKDAKKAKAEKPEKKPNPLYRQSKRRKERVADEVIRWIVDNALDDRVPLRRGGASLLPHLHG